MTCERRGLSPHSHHHTQPSRFLGSVRSHPRNPNQRRLASLAPPLHLAAGDFALARPATWCRNGASGRVWVVTYGRFRQWHQCMQQFIALSEAGNYSRMRSPDKKRCNWAASLDCIPTRLDLAHAELASSPKLSCELAKARMDAEKQQGEMRSVSGGTTAALCPAGGRGAKPCPFRLFLHEIFFCMRESETERLPLCTILVSSHHGQLQFGVDPRSSTCASTNSAKTTLGSHDARLISLHHRLLRGKNKIKYNRDKRDSRPRRSHLLLFFYLCKLALGD